MAKSSPKISLPKPVGERILIQFIEESNSDEGIILPDTAESSTRRATVVEVGEGGVVPQIPLGSTVIIPYRTTNEIKIGDNKYYVVHATEILAVIK